MWPAGGHPPGMETRQQTSSPFQCFDSKYRWQVTRNLLPMLTFIKTRED
jgi:hypothetical protein